MTLLYGNTMHWTGIWDCFPCRAEDSEAEKGSELLKNLRPAVVGQGPVVLPTGAAGREQGGDP